MQLGYIPPEDARPGGSRTPVRDSEARFAAEHGVDVSAVGAWGVDPLGDGATEERALEHLEGQ